MLSWLCLLVGLRLRDSLTATLESLSGVIFLALERKEDRYDKEMYSCPWNAWC
jgi:hypothetical protein